MSRKPWQVSMMDPKNWHEQDFLRCSGAEIGLALEALLLDCPTWQLREDLYGPSELGNVPRSEFPPVDHAMGPTLEAESRCYKVDRPFDDDMPLFTMRLTPWTDEQQQKALELIKGLRFEHKSYRPTLEPFSASFWPDNPTRDLVQKILKLVTDHSLGLEPRGDPHLLIRNIRLLIEEHISGSKPYDG